MIKMQVGVLSLRMEAVPVLVHGEVDLLAQTLDEHRVPVLIIQQAAQGETDRAVSSGHFSFTLEEKRVTASLGPE